jgi:hypothetical protein
MSNNLLAQASQQQAATLLALPLDKLFGAPFTAAVAAQTSLAMTTAYFLSEFAMDPSGNMYTFTTSSYYDIAPAKVQDASGNQAYYLYYGPAAGPTPTLDPSGVGVNYTARTISNPSTTSQGQRFSGNAGTHEVSGNLVAVDNSGRIIGSQGQRSLTLPFVSLLNVPSLAMTEVTVDFVIKITTQDTSTTSTATSNTTNTSVNQQYSGGVGGYFPGVWWGVSWSGSTSTNTTAVATSNNDEQNKSSTSSTYRVHMAAKQKEPIGLKMMLDFITNNASDNAAPMQLASDGYSTEPKPTSNIMKVIPAPK